MNSLNYIGSKYTLFPSLKPHFERIIKKCGEKVVFGDLFSGTGIVGYSIGVDSTVKVISNDIQYYSYVLNRASLSIYTGSEIEQINTLVNEYNAIEGVFGFVSANYAENEKCERMYFSPENAGKIDAIRERIKDTKDTMSDNVYYYLLANLISSADKVASTSCVYGAYLKSLKKAALKPIKMVGLTPDTPIVKIKGDVYCENVSKLVTKLRFDVVYLDPPYNNRQYAPNYHVLETIARYDNPEIHGKTGLRDYSDQKSDFCVKKLVAIKMEELIRDLNTKFIMISYNDEGLIGKDQFISILEKYGKLEIVEIDYKKFKAQQGVTREKTVEYLFILQKD